MLKKNISIILVIVLTLLLIMMVIRVFDKRIEAIEKSSRVENVIKNHDTRDLQFIQLNQFKHC